MPKFIGYTTYDNEDALVLSQDEFKEHGGLTNVDWAEYVWIGAADKAEAYARYDDCIAEYEADNNAGRPIKDAY